VSGSKGQDQGADIDDLIKSAGKILDAWKKAIDDIAKDLSKLDDGKGGGDKGGGDKGGGDKGAAGKGGAGKGGDAKKVQTQAEKDAEEASKKLNEDLKKMLQGQKPPSDPKQTNKLTDFMGKYIDKNGLKLKDWGSVKPDIDIDPKKMQLKKLGVEWTWKW
jgi:hypothetical protein